MSTIIAKNQTTRRMKRSVSRLTVPVALLLASQVAMAQVPGKTPIDRTKQPAADPAPKASFPKYEEFTLSNGLKVYLVHDEHPVVTMRLLVRGGNDRDGSVSGLADAAANGLTDGTTKRNAQQFADQLDFVGATVTTSTVADNIAVTASGLTEQLPTILDLFSDAVKNPAYSADQLSKYKEERISNLKVSQSEPGTLATHAVNKYLYGDTPLGIPESEESISKFSPEMLRKFHDTYFVPGNASLAVVGSMSKDQLKNMLETAFKDWKKGPTPAPVKLNLPANNTRRIIVVDRPASVQSSVRVIGKGPLWSDTDFPKTYIMNSILGGGTGLGNRLTMNLRETHSYTYTPYSYFDVNSYLGYYEAAADVRNSVTDSAVQQTFYEIDRIQKEPVPDDELQRNIQSAVGEYLISLSNPERTARRVQSINFYGLPKDYYDRLVSAYTSTSSKDVMSLAKKYLKDDNLSVVVVGKASEIKPKLEQFGKVEVWDADMKPADGNASADIGMTANQVVDKMVDALGGKAKIQAIKSLKSTSKISGTAGPQQFSGTFTRVNAAPNKQYELLDLGMIRQETFNNGTTVVKLNPGQPAQTLEGEDLAKELEQSHILPEGYIQELGITSRVLGKKEKNGHQVIALELTMPKNGAIIYYVDANTFLPYMQESAEGGTVTFEDWKEIPGGVKVPYKLTIEPQPGVKLVASDFKYEVNTPIDDATFVKK